MPNKSTSQMLAPQSVIQVMCGHACEYMQRMPFIKVFVLAVLAGAFITAGALFSILLSYGVDNASSKMLLMGVGFSVGFFFVILSATVLFTEVNVTIPTGLLHCNQRKLITDIVSFWLIAWLGNFIGALMIGYVIAWANYYPSDAIHWLQDVVAMKLYYQTMGSASAWGQVVVSGMLANWLVGMAAFFATMGHSVIDKYIPVLLAVSLFVVANFQHSPANMGYFALFIATGEGPSWLTALSWNIIPAGIGNMLGGALLVSLPLWYTTSERYIT